MKSLKIVLPIGLVLFFITGLTTRNIRLDSEKYLKNEETITAAGNGQILSQREALLNLENERSQAREDRAFKRRLGLSD